MPIYREGKIVAAISVAAIEQRLNKRRRLEVVDIIRNAIKPLEEFDTTGNRNSGLRSSTMV